MHMRILKTGFDTFEEHPVEAGHMEEESDNPARAVDDVKYW